jgi:putative ABC transport system permease protein
MRFEFIDNLRQDILFSLRVWRRSPGFTAVAISILALAIGANAAIFSVVRGVLLKPLAYPEPSQLALISTQFPALGQDQFWVDPAEFMDFRERVQSFAGVGAYVTGAVDIGAETHPQRVNSAGVSADLFGILGVAPLKGRTFTPQEALPNAARVAVLSYELWKSTYNGDESIVGTPININGAQTTVVGIMPAGFDVHDRGVKVWLPLVLDPAQRAFYRGNHSLMLIGRLKRGMTLAQARAELEPMLSQWATLSAVTGKDVVPNTTTHRMRYDDLRGDIIRNVCTALWVLQAAVGVVLVIACANLANLLLMRAEQRQRELAVRVALGAGRGRLLQQFAVESFMLSLVGGAAGIALAEWGLHVMVSANAGSIPRSGNIHLDGTVLAFGLVLVSGTSIAFGLIPLLHLDPRGVGQTLREAGSRTTAGTARSGVRRMLVVSEIAMAATLVVSATLLVRSFLNLMHVDAGFDRSRLTTFVVPLPTATYRDSTRRIAFFDNLVESLASVPGVDAAAALRGLPPMRDVDANATDFEGQPVPQGEPPKNVDYYQSVTPGYFATMGIPITAGREFDRRDGPSAPLVVVINQALARSFYPGQDPVGKRIRPSGDTSWFTVAGVAKDVKQGGLGSATGTELYFVYEQIPRQKFGYVYNTMNVVVRSRLSADVLGPTIQKAVRTLDPTVPVTGLSSMDGVFSASLNRPRFLAQLLGMFATAAMLLAAIGTYGVLAYSVATRRQEIGIRVALGANAQRVLAMVLREGMTLAAIGLIIGLGAAVGTTHAAASLLFGVSPADPWTFAAVAVLLLGVAFLACLLPARRATRVDPMVALRAE